MILDKKVKSALRQANKKDSQGLFNAVYSKILWLNHHSEIDDLQGIYDIFAAEKVNNPRSRFYIYG